MARIIAITNLKGEVGETTTAINLSNILEAGQYSYAVVLIPQENLKVNEIQCMILCVTESHV